MIRTVLLLSSVCGLVRSSGVHGGAHLAPVAAIGPPVVPVANAPVVTAASSQYFQRTFNRLVVPQAVVPIGPPPPLQPVFPVGPPPPVFVEPTRSVPVAVNPQQTQQDPVHPNVAIAIATAHAAAPVATILLPPYPFGFPPNIGFIPPEQPINVPDENTKEPTTKSTTQAEVTTIQEPEQTTPIPSSSDDSFVQALPSNEDLNFKQYGTPLPPPGSQFQPDQPHPQFQPNQPRPQFQPQQPRPQFPPQQPQPKCPPQQPQPQFPPQQPQPQFPSQQPQPQFPLQQPQPQFPSQQPQPQLPLQQPQQQFPPQQSQPQFPPYQPQPQFPPQQPRPQFQPAAQTTQHRPQLQPQARPQQQPRPVYQAPQQPWPQHRVKPQKLKTSVEVVPVPLAYIAPPPLHKTHAHVKVVKHIYTFVPSSSAKIILRPVKVRPVRLVKVKSVRPQNFRANARDIEVTTFSPFRKPNTKPPRV